MRSVALLNPFLGYPIGQGWTEGSHKNNPAIDYGTPVGTRFTSPESGVYRHLPTNLSRTDPTAPGRIGELLITAGTYAGYRIRFAHLDAHLAAHGTRVDHSTVLAATGNTGYVRPLPTPQNPHAGAHMHTYGLTPAGARWNWTLYATGGGSSAGGDSKPFPKPIPPATRMEAGPTMRVVRNIKDDIGDNVWPQGDYLVTENGITGVEKSNLSTVNRVIGLPANKPPEEFYSSELRDLDRRLRAARS